MKKIIFLLISVSLIASENDFLNLLDDLENASKIATRSKLNIDKTPAIVSILHAKELKKLGIVSLYEALETVPGIEVSMGTGGGKQINMRGNKSLIRDKLKLMINGVSVNSELTGSIFFYLDYPIELIERIEVIRGPASALYGSFANIGVVNVITKNATDSNGVVFTKINSEGYATLGFEKQFTLDNIKVALDGFSTHNNKSREYGPYTGISSQSSFTSYEDFDVQSVGVNIELDNDISLNSRVLQRDAENYYGYADWPIVQDPKRLKATSITSEFRYSPKLNKNTSMDLKAGYREYEFAGKSRYVPYSILGNPHDLIIRGYYREEGFYSDIAFTHKKDKHQILFGGYASTSKIASITYDINDITSSEATNIRVTNIKPGVSRDQYAFYLHDIYSISPELTFNIGGRYDYYSDADSSFSPKLALVYNKSNEDSYKLMYQRSFRTPSFIELYGIESPYVGDESLKSETIDTIEFAYSHQSSLNNRFTWNIFYSDMKNFVNRQNGSVFFNDEKIRSLGTELEWQFPILDSSKFKSNYSYIHIENENGERLPFIANHLANVMLFTQWTREFSSGTTLRYISKQHREAADTRTDLDGYKRVNQTFTYSHKDFTFQAAIKNLFNEAIVFPAEMKTYENDLIRDGRTFWFSVGWRL